MYATLNAIDDLNRNWGRHVSHVQVESSFRGFLLNLSTRVFLGSGAVGVGAESGSGLRALTTSDGSGVDCGAGDAE